MRDRLVHIGIVALTGGQLNPIHLMIERDQWGLKLI
jgi:hypothetical protein